MRNVFAFALAAAGLALMAGSIALFGVRAPAHPAPVAPRWSQASWSEARWPFLLDQWGIGKAFVCLPADCGVRLNVYVRPKIGFCNCATGVSDDTELERVADTDLVSPNPQPLGPGRLVQVGWMKGLSRSYRVSDGETTEALLSVAYNNACDVIVAVATLGDRDQAAPPALIAPAAVETAVLAFLNSAPMLRWARKELGL